MSTSGLGAAVSASVSASKSKSNGNFASVATGAGKDSNLDIIGSDISATSNVSLTADNKINLIAAQDTEEQHRKSKIRSDYASVQQQSGILAGDGGFDLKVNGNTDLKGAVIGSTQAAIGSGRNRLTTGTLTPSEIQNRSVAEADSMGVSASMSGGADLINAGSSSNIANSKYKAGKAVIGNLLNTGSESRASSGVTRSAISGGGNPNIANSKYEAGKAVIGNLLNNGRESRSSSGVTRSAISTGVVIITDDQAQQARTGKTGDATVASINRNTATANTVVQKQDVQEMKQAAEAERVIKQAAVKIVTAFTDETYRSRFQETPKFFKVECPAGANCVVDPSQLKRTPATPQEVAANASPDMVMAVNGILNDEKRAMELAYQNAANVDKTPQNPDGNKPTTIFLMHVKPADNTLSELMGVAYEKATNSMSYGLANFLGYANAAETYAGSLASREDRATNSLGHSRGTLVQESSFTILANRPDENGDTYTNPNLTVRGVGGAADAQSYTDAAAKVQGPKGDKGNITYSYFSNDPVSTSTFSGGNSGVWTMKDLWQVFQTNNSMHSCYGTGGNGCTQVEAPIAGGPQGTPEGNARLIQFKGGQQVDRDGNPTGLNLERLVK